MFEPNQILWPTSYNTLVELDLSDIAQDFVRKQENAQRLHYNDLLYQKLCLQIEHAELRGRCPSFQPFALSVTRKWFLDQGIEATNEIAGLSEKFKHAGGQAREVGKVMRLLEDNLVELIEVEMKLVMFHDEIEQYRWYLVALRPEFPALMGRMETLRNQMMEKLLIEEDPKRVKRG